MAYTVESRANTAADSLREALSKVERLIVNPGAGDVEQLLVLLDQIEQMTASFSERDVDLRSELARWEAIQSRLHNNPRAVVQAANALGGLKSLRAKHPPATAMWWSLDELYATRTRKAIQRSIITLLTIVVVVVGGWQLINYIFPPDPTAVAMLQASNLIESFVSQGDLPSARAAVDDALAKTPDAPEMLVWSIVLAEQMQDTARAQQDLEKSRKLFADQLPEFLVMLGNQRYQLGNLDGAEAAANEAKTVNEREPQVYLLLASVAEARGDVSTAIDYFQKTYDLADNNPQLQVVARYRMGQLLQQAPVLATSTQVTNSTIITP